MKVIFIDDGVERLSGAELCGPAPSTLRRPVIEGVEEDSVGRRRPVFGEKVYQLVEVRGDTAVYA